MRGAYCDISSRGSAMTLDHLVQDEQPRPARLLQRFLHDLGGDVRDFDVHLEAGDAVLAIQRP